MHTIFTHTPAEIRLTIPLREPAHGHPHHGMYGYINIILSNNIYNHIWGITDVTP